MLPLRGRQVGLSNISSPIGTSPPVPDRLYYLLGVGAGTFFL